MKNGLIDKIASYEEAKKMVSNTLGVDQYYRLETASDLWKSLFAKAENLLPKSDSQVLKETAEEFESGVFMYYAQ